jgi:sugar phosphate isomerase/epimerase
MRIGRDLHLTYCTNIHPGNDWAEVESSLAGHGPVLKRRLSPDQAFGIGLRLSHQASLDLLAGERLAAFKEQLARDGLYVFTMNGFPYGSFHRERVKELVHAPDWQTEERADYTIRLAQILAALLPDDVPEGSISTSPLSYKRWQENGAVDVWGGCVRQLVRVVQALLGIERTTGKYIHVDLEPEPDGLVETVDEVCSFFREHLFRDGAMQLAQIAGFSVEAAQEAIQRHLGVCLDTCHMAIEYESPEAYVDKLGALGIRIGKVQISSALKVMLSGRTQPRHDLADMLAPYVESTYLHQVIQRNQDGRLVRYPDLPEALACLPAAGTDAQEWRVHFHVPVFTESCGAFGTTQQNIVDTLVLLARVPFTRHLEIETYTWDVLPEELKVDLDESIVREFLWVQRTFATCMQAGRA